jgi:hypothetical protein
MKDSWANLALSAGASTALAISAFNRSVTAAGMSAGPQMPYHERSSKPSPLNSRSTVAMGM